MFRKEGFKGEIVLVSAESSLPYDRPKLSKKLDASAADLELTSAAWFREAGVDLRLGLEIDEVKTDERVVVSSAGDRISYDKLLVATGGTPRKLGVPGQDLVGVRYLRTPADANYLIENARDRCVVIVGGSFIGMEVASALVGVAKKLTIVDRNSVSFHSSLGDQVGAILQQMHVDHGVCFEMEAKVERFVGTDDGRLKSVLLASGKQLEADMVLVGAGVTPNTRLLAGIEGILDASGLVPVDEFMKTARDDIFAAGDIVRFPLLAFGGEMVNIGHWGLAMYMGRVAALSILGKPKAADSVPFFWTVQFGKSVRFAGTTLGCDNVKVEESGPGKFIAVYSRAGVVRGVASLGLDPAAATFKSVTQQGTVIKLEEAFEKLKPVPAS